MQENPPAELEGARIASDFILANDLIGDDDVDTQLLRKMSGDAQRYIASFSWCASIRESYFAGGVGGIFAVFFFHIHPGRPAVHPWIWIVVGDIPPAYLPVSDCKSPAEVFETYIRGMTKWVELARAGKTGSPEDGVPPVSVPATPEWAEKLDKRLSGLIKAVKLFFDRESGWVN